MKLNKTIIAKTRKFVKKIYDKKAEFTHDWSHIMFVVRISKYIAKKEKMDVQITEMGALLHDIGYPLFRKKPKEFMYGDHATPSAKKAKKFLKSLNLDKDIINHILDTILYHSGKNVVKAKTPEAKAIYDADKLHNMGPVGILRIIGWNIKYEHPNATIKENYDMAIEAGEKRLKRLQTKTGRELGKKYQNYIKGFKKGWKVMN